MQKKNHRYPKAEEFLPHEKQTMTEKSGQCLAKALGAKQKGGGKLFRLSCLGPTNQQLSDTRSPFKWGAEEKRDEGKTGSRIAVCIKVRVEKGSRVFKRRYKGQKV